jgi:hypothetical protein
MPIWVYRVLAIYIVFAIGLFCGIPLIVWLSYGTHPLETMIIVFYAVINPW